MNKKLAELKRLLREARDLYTILQVLNWDEATYLPPGGAGGRGRQKALLAGITQQRLADPAIGRLLDELQPYAESLPHDSADSALLRVARREFERAVRIPPEFMARFANHQSESFLAWQRARQEKKFAIAIPYLEKMLAFSRQLADFFPGYDHIADPLIDEFEPGVKARRIRQIFGELRKELVPLVRAIGSLPQVDDACLHQFFPDAAQWQFGVEVVEAVGYDFERGRLDRTPHPFTIRLSEDDVRITTRMDERNLLELLFGNIHEAGHALYEQGTDPGYDGTPLGHGTSSAVHESQSRLLENMVGRSLPFWEYYYPRLQAAFPNQLGATPLPTFYRAINKVTPSLIRTDADEVTYDLHVMLRFDLELEMLEGKLAVRDLAEAWRARYQADLGVVPPDDKTGVLQDVHWYTDRIGGMFQGYSLGNILRGMFWAAALDAHPEIPAQMAQGNFATLLEWLRQNIHTHGARYTTDELAERVTGGPLRVEPYLRYLRGKYGELYRL